MSSHDGDDGELIDRDRLEAAAARGWEEDTKCDFEPRDGRGKIMDCDVFTLYREKKLMSIRYQHSEL